MLHTTYTLIVQFTAKPGKEQALANALSALVAPTRAEPGCVLYTLHQSTENRAEFYFYEAWVDKAAHTAHGKTAHIQTWRKQRDALIADCKVLPCQALKVREVAGA